LGKNAVFCPNFNQNASATFVVSHGVSDMVVSRVKRTEHSVDIPADPDPDELTSLCR